MRTEERPNGECLGHTNGDLKEAWETYLGSRSGCLRTTAFEVLERHFAAEKGSKDSGQLSLHEGFGS